MPDLRYQPKSRVKPESTYLQVVRSNVTSQAGEDGIIERVFSMIGASNKWCVEFGAWDGRHLSNTWNLLINKKWYGVLIESDSARFQKLQQTHAHHDRAILVNRFITLYGGDSLDAVLAETPAPLDLDLISIDVDGQDWHLWNSLERYRPRLVIVEFNYSIPNDVYYVQDPDPNVHEGSSLLAMIELGKQKGYELIATTPLNAFFVVKELFDQFQIEDNDIDAMHSPGKYEFKLFQLYDGTLVLTGCQRLLWADIPIEQEDIQVLPPDQRRFKG